MATGGGADGAMNARSALDSVVPMAHSVVRRLRWVALLSLARRSRRRLCSGCTAQRSDATRAAVLRVCTASAARSVQRSECALRCSVCSVQCATCGGSRSLHSKPSGSVSEWCAETWHLTHFRMDGSRVGRTNNRYTNCPLELINSRGAFTSRVIIAPIICLFGVVLCFSH